MKEWTFLLVDSSSDDLNALKKYFSEDYQVITARCGKDALKQLESNEIDLILSALCLKDMSGLDLFMHSRINQPEAIRILVAGHDELGEIENDLRESAVYQVIRKPWHPTSLQLLVKRALESRELARRHRYLSRALKFSDSIWKETSDVSHPSMESNREFDRLVFVSESMLQVCSLAQRGAVTALPVLIQGETGTGKELLARAIHSFSSRSKYPFLVQNCGALPDELLQSELFGHKRGAFTGAVSDRQGLFEVAHGSTMFLDEIGDMALETQAKLLRTLQTGEIRPVGSTQSRNVDVRIIAATNRDMLKAMREGRFREDLFYRINTFTINLPPLRYRGEDLPLLVDYFLRRACARINKRVDHVSPTAISLLREYNWPGNLREMQNVIESAVIMAGSEMIEPENIFFPHDNRAPQRVSNMKFMDAKAAAIGEFERQSLTRYLAESAGNISKAAESAGLSRRTFHRLMEKHRISSRRNRE